jgi:hypothetical protein
VGRSLVAPCIVIAKRLASQLTVFVHVLCVAVLVIFLLPDCVPVDLIAFACAIWCVAL